MEAPARRLRLKRRAALEGVGIAICFDRSIIFSSKLIFKNHCYVCRTHKGLIRLPPPPGVLAGVTQPRPHRLPYPGAASLRSANAYARLAVLTLLATGTTKGCDPEGNETGRDRHGASNAARLRSPIVLYPASLPHPPNLFVIKSQIKSAPRRQWNEESNQDISRECYRRITNDSSLVNIPQLIA